MCKEVFFWFTEYLNYFALIFFGIKLFLKKYDVHTGRKEWVENVFILVASAPVVWFAADNYRFVLYSNPMTYLIVVHIYLFVKIYSKIKIKIFFPLVAIYVHVVRLIDLLIVTIIFEVNYISRFAEWDLIHFGYERSMFLIFLVVCYWKFYNILKNKKEIFLFLFNNSFYTYLLCFYSFLGIITFYRVYRFEYSGELIKYWIFYLVIAFIILGGFLFYFIEITIREKERMLNLRNDMMKEKYYELERVYDNNKTLQHDYKNHMLAIYELIKRNNINDALNYIDAYINISKMKSEIQSGNNIVDIIINSKIIETEEKKIKFKYEIDYLGNIPINDIDLCALLANLLDNAVESCEKISNPIKEIHLKIYIKQSTLIIKIVNSIHKEMMYKKVIFESEKDNSQLHGWGMKSVERVIKRYDGFKRYKLDNSYLELFISIPL